MSQNKIYINNPSQELLQLLKQLELNRKLETNKYKLKRNNFFNKQ